MRGWKFKRQKPIGRYIADFCCASAKLIVELDGAVHDTPEAQIYDVQREADLQALGYTVLRFCNEEVLKDTAAVLERIAATLP